MTNLPTVKQYAAFAPANTGIAMPSFTLQQNTVSVEIVRYSIYFNCWNTVEQPRMAQLLYSAFASLTNAFGIPLYNLTDVNTSLEICDLLRRNHGNVELTGQQLAGIPAGEFPWQGPGMDHYQKYVEALIMLESINPEGVPRPDGGVCPKNGCGAKNVIVLVRQERRSDEAFAEYALCIKCGEEY
jgi:hypothetical protein